MDFSDLLGISSVPLRKKPSTPKKTNISIGIRSRSNSVKPKIRTSFEEQNRDKRIHNHSKNESKINVRKLAKNEDMNYQKEAIMRMCALKLKKKQKNKQKIIREQQTLKQRKYEKMEIEIARAKAEKRVQKNSQKSTKLETIYAENIKHQEWIEQRKKCTQMKQKERILMDKENERKRAQIYLLNGLYKEKYRLECEQQFYKKEDQCLQTGKI